MGWIWCVHTHDVALSDTVTTQGRWDLRRARGRGFRQVRVPGAAAGDSSCATAGIEPSSRLTIRTEVGTNSKWHHAADAAHRRRRVVGQPFVPSPRSYTTRSCWRKTRLLRGKPGGMS